MRKGVTRKRTETSRRGDHYPGEESEENETGGGFRSHLELDDTHRVTVFSEFQRFEFPPEANPKQCVMTQLHELPYKR